jgi:hypothetical protein
VKATIQQWYDWTMETATETSQGPELSPDEILSDELRFRRWQDKRPPIGHLADAIHVPNDGTDAVPLFDMGDRIVVDCCTDLLRGLPWLQTIVGTVRSIDDTSGTVSLYDEDSDARNPMVRFVSFKSNLFTLKLAPAKGDPFEPPSPERQPKPQPMPGQKGRGRPKGSKNRPKDIIKAEREARKAARGRKD